MDQDVILGMPRELLDDTEDLDSLYNSKYFNAVQVMAPIELLQQMDRLMEAKPSLTRQDIVLRALRLYLKLHDPALRLGAQSKTSIGTPREGSHDPVQ